ncbi:hypothetical protein [Streptomyces sp. NPDC059928]|uniref:hypothetical protein n=1 Tax=unclassified Streptomyces TaxID=2593676 RepID=UPI003657C1CE
MTDVIVSAEAVEEVQPAGAPDALNDQLISQLVDRAKADGVKPTGQGGLLQQQQQQLTIVMPDHERRAWQQPIPGRRRTLTVNFTDPAAAKSRILARITAGVIAEVP